MSLDTAKAVGILRSLTAKFDNAMETADTFYPQVCTIIQSDGADEQYGLLGNMPGVREWLGDRVFHELRAGHFTIVNKLWEDSLLIKKTDLADDRMGLYPALLEELGKEAACHPDELMFTAIVNGESTACFDGQYFFDTDHSWGSSGTQDNDLTYAAATGTVPTAAEFKAAYNQARTAMVKYKNDQGKFLNRSTIRRQSDLMVLIPPDVQQQAEDALLTPLSGGGNTNRVIDTPRIVVSPLLTDATKWYLINTGAILKPFVFQAREPISRQMKGHDDIETKDVKFMTQARYNVGYLAWWTAVLTTWT